MVNNLKDIFSCSHCIDENIKQFSSLPELLILAKKCNADIPPECKNNRELWEEVIAYFP
jgi:hypothetical protein